MSSCDKPDEYAEAGDDQELPQGGAEQSELSDQVATESKEDAEAGTSESLLQHIASLKQQQDAARKERKKLARDLKKAQRKRRRLKARARQLSNADLMEVLSMRNYEAATSSAGPSKKTADPSQSSSKKLKT